MSRLPALLWLLTSLSILQWTPPSVDPDVFARLITGQERSAGLALTDHSSPAVEARAVSATFIGDKRSSTLRTAPIAADDTATAASSIRLPVADLAATLLVARAYTAPPAVDHLSFTARSPPPRG